MLYENKFESYFIKANLHLQELMMPLQNDVNSYSILKYLNIIRQVMKKLNKLLKLISMNLIQNLINLQFH